ncbi:hypothetical protein BBJ28_00019178 [Nothophytophthora sp. Chile5]|nr:hypothetical protein BBJ28_00019178 [Nothophytophthora sp. Chile5]
MGSVFSSKKSPEAAVNPKRPKKFSYSDVRLMKEYLPSLVYYEKSTEEHRRIAAAHWDQVYKDVPAQRTASVVSTPGAPKVAKHITKAQNSKITDLYDVFYAYLEEHGGDLKHVFRSSMHVRGRVLVHISSGMRTMLASENIAEKILALTKTHRRFGVRLEHFDCVGRGLVHAMERTSGEHWSPEIADAWRRMFSHSSVILIRLQKKSDRQMSRDAARVAKEKERGGMVSVGPTSNLVVAKPISLVAGFTMLFPSLRSKRDDSRSSKTTT